MDNRAPESPRNRGCVPLQGKGVGGKGEVGLVTGGLPRSFMLDVATRGAIRTIVDLGAGVARLEAHDEAQSKTTRRESDEGDSGCGTGRGHETTYRT